jgi:hypothetical protein
MQTSSIASWTDHEIQRRELAVRVNHNERKPSPAERPGPRFFATKETLEPDSQRKSS